MEGSGDDNKMKEEKEKMKKISKKQHQQQHVDSPFEMYSSKRKDESGKGIRNVNK